MYKRIMIAAGFILAGLLAVGPLRAQEGDDSFRAKALALNKVTGDAAIKGKIRELHKDKPALRKMLAEAAALVKENEKENGKETDKKKKKDSPFGYSAAFILARSAQAIRDYETSELFYKLCVEHAFELRSTQKLADVFKHLMDVFERSKKYDDALFICQKFLELKGDEDDENIERIKPLVIERMIEILCRQKKFDKAMEMTEKMVEASKRGWYFLHRKAEVLRAWGKAEEALTTYKEVIELLEKSDLPEEDKNQYIDHCKYVTSGVYVDAGKVDKSIEVLEELVKAHPDNSTYNNDLGYILADNDKRLDEAEAFVRKALDQDRDERKKIKAEGELEEDDDKDNSAYLDSLAWVYFKQKKYAEARDIMLEVVKSEESQHIEIYDHLADIYLALGQKDDAVKTWKKGLTLETNGRRDEARQETVKKKIEANK